MQEQPLYVAKTARITKRVAVTFTAASVVILSGLPSQVVAEYPVERYGTFAVRLPTPDCDDIFDALEDIGDFVWDGVEYLGETQLDMLEGVGELAMGNPGPLIDRVNKSFEDLGTAAATISDYSPLALASVVVSALPAGDVTDFLRAGTDLSDQLRRQVISGAVEGLNPIQTADTVLNDLGEIGGDLVNVLKNLDDPASLGNEFLKFQQKWSGAGALTYILTEGDPMVGMQKALQALHRQVEIVTTYGGAPKGDAAQALLGLVMDETDNFINNMQDPKKKKAAAALAATFAVSFRNTMSDPSRVVETSAHPFYNAHLRNVEAEWFGDAHNDGGKHDWGLQHPKVEDQPGCISLGDYVYAGRDSDSPKHLKAVCGVEPGRDKWWSRPVDYKLIWGDNCSGATHDRSIWNPICPKGFVSVGFVVWKESSEKPLPNRIACLKDDLSLLNVVDGRQAGLTWRANDEGSGAKYNVTVYNRIFAGMKLMYAVNEDRPVTDSRFLQARVPVAWGEPSATGIMWTDTAGYPTGGPGQASRRLPDGEYTIQQKSKMRFLDAHEGRNDNEVVTRGSQNLDPSQVWVLRNRGGDNYRMQQKSNMRYLDAHPGSDGNAVTRDIQYDDSQLWIVKSDPYSYGDTFTIQHAMNQRYLDAHEDGGYNVVTRPPQNNSSQQWVITMTPASRAEMQRQEAEAARQREARAAQQRDMEAAQLRAAQEAAALAAQQQAAQAAQQQRQAAQATQQRPVQAGAPPPPMAASQGAGTQQRQPQISQPPQQNQSNQPRTNQRPSVPTPQPQTAQQQFVYRVVASGSPDAQIYVTSNREVVVIAPNGQSTLAGTLMASEDPNYQAFIRDGVNPDAYIDFQNRIYGYDGNNNWVVTGYVEELSGTNAQRQSQTNQQQNSQQQSNQAQTSQAQQSQNVQQGYVYRVIASNAPDAQIYVTSNWEVVLLAPNGESTQIGTAMQSQDSNYQWIIRDTENVETYIDFQNQMYGYDDNNNWVVLGYVDAL